MSENSDHSEKEYAEQLLRTGRLLESAIRQAIQALQLEQGSVGLDAGCGIGTHTIQLGEAVGPGGKVTGLDISPGLLSFARKTAQQSGMSDVSEFHVAYPGIDAHFSALVKRHLWPADCGSSLPGYASGRAVQYQEVRRRLHALHEQSAQNELFAGAHTAVAT